MVRERIKPLQNNGSYMIWCCSARTAATLPRERNEATHENITIKLLHTLTYTSFTYADGRNTYRLYVLCSIAQFTTFVCHFEKKKKFSSSCLIVGFFSFWLEICLDCDFTFLFQKAFMKSSFIKIRLISL